MNRKPTIVLGVTGGIAAFKAAQLTSNLIKKDMDVEVIMTKNATEFIAPLTFEALTKHNVMVSTFDRIADRSVKHIAIAKRADVFAIVPASANVIAKIVHGLADDMLTTTFLAASCPKIICPAMNTAMYENPITQRNIGLLKEYGMEVVEPESGLLACGDVGTGKLADLNQIEDAIAMACIQTKVLNNKNVVISAGPTQEALDPVRFLSNHSSGKMGIALAWCAKALGAKVTLIHGPIHEPIPYGIHTLPVTSAQEMWKAFQNEYQSADVIIKAAAVSDYRPLAPADHKIKKQADTLTLPLQKNPDILAWLGEHKPQHQVLCGFAMETEQLLENAAAKRQAKNCDLLVANNLNQAGAGFANDTNVVTIITESKQIELPCMSKRDVAFRVWEQIIAIMKTKGALLC